MSRQPQPTMTCPRTFSRASRQFLVFASSFDWFTGLLMAFVIVYMYVLAAAISLVLVLRHSIEDRSNKPSLGKEKSTR